MYICEIVSSIQGESKNVGYPTTFVRTYGCNNRCSYCDQSYSYSGKKIKISTHRIAEQVRRMGNKYVCITGGEPLLQAAEVYPLVYDLCGSYFIVNIETNGSIIIDKDFYNRSYFYTMDIKCPSSGVAANNCYSNLENLQAKDEVKFVINDYTDYIFAKGIIKQYYTPASIIFSPCFNADGGHNAKELSEWILADGLNVRLGVQIHKVIGIY